MHNYFTADFETTTVEPAAVWAWGVSSIENPETCYYGETLDSFMEWCRNSKNARLYFHNQKFDGGFILDWLFRHGFEWRHIIIYINFTSIFFYAFIICVCVKNNFFFYFIFPNIFRIHKNI